MTQLETLIDPEQIRSQVQKAALEIDEMYKGQELMILMVMKGAICLVADLMRMIQVPCTLEYLRASSYGERGKERGELKIQGLDEIDCSGRHVLVVDDIFDSGNTLKGIMEALKVKLPLSLKSLVLLHKNLSRTVRYRPDFILFEIENHFVVGYGLDYKEHFRGLPGIYKLL
ncbi:MAG: hypoxanthine phosphoribosyltransferase [Rhabdochlamydiaceae bacterium]|nr:hypoxanthine phosphoribosyltransferase [Rhabdochlamydiaceae bacterium]